METHFLATCSRIWDDLLGRQSMSRKEMCLKLSKTELQGDGCTPVGISQKEKCQRFPGFPQPKQELRAPQNCFHDAHSDTVTTDLKNNFPIIYTWKLGFLQRALKNPGRSSRKAKHIPKRNVSENCGTQKDPEAKKAPCCTPVGFHRREGEKVPKVSEISSTKQNWEFSADFH